jgi:ribosomal protein L19E
VNLSRTLKKTASRQRVAAATAAVAEAQRYQGLGAWKGKKASRPRNRCPMRHWAQIRQLLAFGDTLPVQNMLQK